MERKIIFQHPYDIIDPSESASDDHILNADHVRIMEDGHMSDVIRQC